MGGASSRRQALDWLREGLEAQRRLLEPEPEKTRWIIVDGLERWLRDPDFAWVSRPDALARLPEAERQAWHQLWADVADTPARAQGTTLWNRRPAARYRSRNGKYPGGR
jgi:hypothetical protein